MTYTGNVNRKDNIFNFRNRDCKHNIVNQCNFCLNTDFLTFQIYFLLTGKCFALIRCGSFLVLDCNLPYQFSIILPNLK